MEFVFNVDNDIKQEYLNERPIETAEAEVFVLRVVDEYEILKNKPIYVLTYGELYEMFLMQFKNSSKESVKKNKSILVNYIDFCIGKNIVIHQENRLRFLDVSELVSPHVLLNRYITKKKVREYQNVLYNEQDKLLLGLLHTGIKGRPTEDGTLEEIINLTIDDVEEETNMLTLTQNNGECRRLKVDSSLIELIKDTYNQKIYIENNGEETNNLRLSKPREFQINQVENYVFRIPGKNKFEKFNVPLLNSRMQKIQTWVGDPYLTYTNLFKSGMIEMAMDRYKEKGKIDKKDFIDICERYNYGSGDPEKYWHVVKGWFEQYKELLEKD